MIEQLFDENYVAALIGFTTGSMRNARSLGKPILPYIVLRGHSIRYKMSEVEKFLAARTVPVHPVNANNRRRKPQPITNHSNRWK